MSGRALFGGIVLVLLGALLVHASWTGVEAGGDHACLTVLQVLGGGMVAQGRVLRRGVRRGGATRSTDMAMFLFPGQGLACPVWLALNTDRVRVM